MPLNYSKWDRLELSDDSDIEGHPNVDHRSLVNWKRREIHEQRAVRNAKIAQLHTSIACNDVLLSRLRSITEEVHNSPSAPSEFSRIVEQLKTNPSPDAPPPPPPEVTGGSQMKIITYDEMILSLLMKVYEDAKEKGIQGNDERLGETLVANLKGHVAKLSEEQDKLKEEVEFEEVEKQKKITSENLHDGWDSHYVLPKPDPKPLKGSHTKTEKKTDIEVLNPKAVEHAQIANLASQGHPSQQTSTNKSSTSATAEDDDEDEDEEVPEMTPILEAFSHLPLKDYESSFRFLQQHRDVYVPGASDALLIAGFRAERGHKPKYAKQCVHQSILIQFCEKLGADGVSLFFKRMMSGDPRADAVFSKDVEDTYAHIVKRVVALRDEEAKRPAEGEGGDGEEAEQIQLVPEGDGAQISFIIPEGPPPEHLHLEGPGTEELDIEEVRKALQMRWDVFNGFPEDLKEALKSQKLDKVNKVLGKMKLKEAEEVVGLLDSAGILNFADGGIRDETGKDVEDAEEGAEDFADDANEESESEDRQA